MRFFEKYVDKTDFNSYEDFRDNFKVNIPENFNFGYDVVDEMAKTNPNLRALCWTNDKDEHIDFTFADIKKKSDQTAAYFQSLGIGRGDMVMVILKRRYQFWFSIIALHKLGAICIPATHLLTKKDIIYRNNAADVKMIVAVHDKQIMESVDAAKADSPSVKHYVSVNGCQEGWDDFNAGIESAAPFVRPTGEDVTNNNDSSLLYFTSGTTGEPKMVHHDFTYPLGHLVTAYYWHKVDNDGLHFTVADTGWGKAVWGKLYGQWMANCAVFVYDYDGKFSPADILTMVEKYKITSFCAPPTIYRFLIKEDFSTYNLSSLNYCTTAGEALSGEVYNKFSELTGIKLMEAFGQTETTLALGNFLWGDPKPGSLGKPAPAYKNCVLIKGDGTECEDGETGQIAFKLDGVEKPLGLCKGYYKDQRRTDEVFRDGYFFTGDTAWRDEEGFFWFVGRADDLIKSSGYRIGPTEVEGALMTHDAVVECAITGVPDKLRGQVVKASVVLAPEFKPGNDKLIKELQDHVKKVTAPYKYPRIVEFVDSLPKTISGKIRRVEIREKS